nr:lysine-rich arabinogalactan protein 18-like [Aegilops tauschii subsp. strangulata]
MHPLPRVNACAWPPPSGQLRPARARWRVATTPLRCRRPTSRPTRSPDTHARAHRPLLLPTSEAACGLPLLQPHRGSLPYPRPLPALLPPAPRPWLASPAVRSASPHPSSSPAPGHGLAPHLCGLPAPRRALVAIAGHGLARVFGRAPTPSCPIGSACYGLWPNARWAPAL